MTRLVLGGGVVDPSFVRDGTPTVLFAMPGHSVPGVVAGPGFPPVAGTGVDLVFAGGGEGPRPLAPAGPFRSAASDTSVRVPVGGPARPVGIAPPSACHGPGRGSTVGLPGAAPGRPVPVRVRRRVPRPES